MLRTLVPGGEGGGEEAVLTQCSRENPGGRHSGQQGRRARVMGPGVTGGLGAAGSSRDSTQEGKAWWEEGDP